MPKTALHLYRSDMPPFTTARRECPAGLLSSVMIKGYSMKDQEQLLDVFGEFLYVADFQTYDLLYMNERCLEALNFTPENYKQKKCYEAIQGRDAPCPFCTNKYLSYDKVYVWEYKNPFLNRHFSIHNKLINWEGRKARIERSFDITDLKKQMLTLEDKLEAMSASIPGGICQLADDGLLTVLWHNDTFLKLIGYTEEQFKNELNGTAGYILPEDMAMAAAALERAKQTRQIQLIEMRIRRRDGEVLTLLATNNYIPASDNVPCPVYYSVGVDITEYKRLLERNEQQVKDELLAKAEAASQSKSRFLSRMSHELRTPLNAVIGMNRLAMRERDNKEALENCHAKIESSAQYLLSLINDVLDFSRIESGKLQLSMQPFSLPAFLYDLYDMFSDAAEDKGLAFSLDVEPFEEEQLSGDMLHLKQVLVNLLSNAFKFTEKHGHVDLKVRKLTGRSRTTILEFTVSDTGIGISPGALKRIFNMFEQENSEIANRYGGSGLGLTISKSLVNLMDGTITAQSQLGEGTTFSIILPFGTGQGPQPADAARYAPAGVLIVDNQRDSYAATRILNAASVKTASASDAAEAVRLLDASADGGTPFDIVLLAASLPDADAVKEHLRRQPGLKGVRLALTGLHLPEQERGADGSAFIRKPFFRSVLLEGLQKLYDEISKEPPQEEAFHFAGKRLLLVEDNELNMEIACELLKAYGFAIEPAHNGEEAVKRFAASPPHYFDAILMDILMPVMDGLTATREIRHFEREDARSVPIIALSANAFEEDRQKSLDSGMNAHVSKPLDLDILCMVLRTFFDTCGGD